jgi:hypothetical protein
MDKSAWAEHLQRDEWFQEMMEELRSAEINKFAMSDYTDSAQREQAYLRLRALEMIDTYLDGLSAQKTIDAKKLKIL